MQISVKDGKYGILISCSNKKKEATCRLPSSLFAEREGFEPSVPVRVQRFSRPSRSATPASFLFYKTLSEWMAWLRFGDLNT